MRTRNYYQKNYIFETSAVIGLILLLCAIAFLPYFIAAATGTVIGVIAGYALFFGALAIGNYLSDKHDKKIAAKLEERQPLSERSTEESGVLVHENLLDEVKEMKKQVMDMFNAACEIDAAEQIKRVEIARERIEEIKESDQTIAEIATATPITSIGNCPITGLQMIFPVIADNGYTYDRLSLMAWYDAGNRACPFDNDTALSDPRTLLINKSVYRFIHGIEQPKVGDIEKPTADLVSGSESAQELQL